MTFAPLAKRFSINCRHYMAKKLLPIRRKTLSNQSINQSIYLSTVSSGLLSRDANIQPSACKASMEKRNHKVDQNIKQYQEIKFVDYLFKISHTFLIRMI